jgi:hypothetical protein
MQLQATQQLESDLRSSHRYSSRQQRQLPHRMQGLLQHQQQCLLLLLTDL